ncbi:MAG: YgiQ family radical SAM protein, partial [Clostridiales bacterium]|nr:YgiQ family radical SAM protein [Clostridiales bacterium]
NYELLPSYSEVAGDKRKYAAAFMKQWRQDKRLAQAHEKGYLVANPPAAPLTTAEMDTVYALPFTRKPHPSYRKPIPALAEVEFSLTSSRGCFGGCHFCALTYHQGRLISTRSHTSLLAEAGQLTKSPNFKGYIHDVGGPTANFRTPACKKQGTCSGKSCIGYKRCPNLEVSHADYLALLRKLRQLPGVKKVFVRSGIRYDYVLYDPDETFLRELVRFHISGQLKIAPEHIAPQTLYYMNKPPVELYERFLAKYRKLNEGAGAKQFVVPYLISSHPGCTLEDAIALAEYLKKSGHRPEQVQDFYPTPGTLSTAMYYTGLDPRTGEEVYVPRGEQEKRAQRALMQYFLPKNHTLVRKALKQAGREDLIGYGKRALVPPEKRKS